MPIRLQLQLINANTSAQLTDAMVARARAFLPEHYAVAGLTAPFGEPYIASRQASAVAAHAVVDLCRGIARAPEPPQAVLIGCFGDPGLWAAREILDCPVIGMAEAACLMACQLGRRFSIVTGGHAWAPMLTEFVAAIGLDSRLASIVTAEFTGAQVAHEPERFVGELAELVGLAVDRDGAEVVILGGAGLVGMAERLAPSAVVPVLDSLSCALAQTLALTAGPRTGA